MLDWIQIAQNLRRISDDFSQQNVICISVAQNFCESVHVVDGWGTLTEGSLILKAQNAWSQMANVSTS